MLLEFPSRQQLMVYIQQLKCLEFGRFQNYIYPKIKIKYNDLALINYFSFSFHTSRLFKSESNSGFIIQSSWSFAFF